jgi:hypothetical protein
MTTKRTKKKFPLADVLTIVCGIELGESGREGALKVARFFMDEKDMSMEELEQRGYDIQQLLRIQLTQFSQIDAEVDQYEKFLAAAEDQSQADSLADDFVTQQMHTHGETVEVHKMGS